MIAPITAACIAVAALSFQVPERALYSILAVEGGIVGQCSLNKDGTKDCGPFQINDRWHDYFAKRWRLEPSQIALVLRDNGCANAYAAANILAKHFQESGNIREAIGRYHNQSPPIKEKYLQRVDNNSLRLFGIKFPG